MLHLSSWMVTLPMMLIGMVGIILVIGIIVLSVMLLNRLTSRKGSFLLTEQKSPGLFPHRERPGLFVCSGLWYTIVYFEITL